MLFPIWFTLIGLLFLTMVLFMSVLQRLPVTSSIFYLAVGLVLGPIGFHLINIDPIESAEVLERVTEVAVIISLFSTGLKLRTPFSDGRWRLPVRLAFVSMTITVVLVALVGVYLLGLPLGAAILLGAVLAPTDPVLASDVQVADADDRDELRFGLTGEAGLNDGSAFPFVMLGLGLLGLHEIGEWGWRWLAVDVLWAIVGGLAVGWGLGILVGKLVVHVRREHKQAVGFDNFIALGLIALAYGLALLVWTYGFLAVFAAGLALRRVELRDNSDRSAEEVRNMVDDQPEEEAATKPETSSAHMVEEVLWFNEQIERIGELAVVVVIGGLLSMQVLAPDAIWFVPLLFLVIRPVSVLIGMIGSTSSNIQRGMMSWFGIRGIGSLYYLMYAIVHDLPEALAERLTSLTLTTVAVSVLIHGISVTPLMRWYGRSAGAAPSSEAAS